MIVWNGVMKKNGHLTATVYCCVKYSCLGMPVRKVLVRDVTGNVGLSAISGVESTTIFWTAYQAGAYLYRSCSLRMVSLWSSSYIIEKTVAPAAMSNIQ